MLKLEFKKSELLEVLSKVKESFRIDICIDDGDLSFFLDGTNIWRNLDFDILCGYSNRRYSFCLDKNECIEFLKFIENSSTEAIHITICSKRELIASYPTTNNVCKKIEFKH